MKRRYAARMLRPACSTWSTPANATRSIFAYSPPTPSTWLGSRRTVEDFEGVWLQVSRPEDAILMRGLLNQSYLDAWAARLDLTALLAELRSEAGPIE